MPIVTENESRTDIGAQCGHTRDRHDAQGKCLIDDRKLVNGGFDGTEGDPVTLPVTGHYHRDACFCPGETVFHRAGLPDGYEWDGLPSSGWRDPKGDRRDATGKYVWWIPLRKKK